MTVELDAESYAFPRDLLKGCSSALLAFCSGRMGAADGHWVREAGIPEVTCIDWDAKTLDPFIAEYADSLGGWNFYQADCFAKIEEWRAERPRPLFVPWDFVSADTPSQYADRMLGDIALWCSVAARYVTCTLVDAAFPDGRAALGNLPTAPADWRYLSLIERSVWQGKTYYWLVLERV